MGILGLSRRWRCAHYLSAGEDIQRHLERHPYQHRDHSMAPVSASLETSPFKCRRLSASSKVFGSAPCGARIRHGNSQPATRCGTMAATHGSQLHFRLVLHPILANSCAAYFTICHFCLLLKVVEPGSDHKISLRLRLPQADEAYARLRKASNFVASDAPMTGCGSNIYVGLEH